jgi:hypothetical protein
MNVLETILGAQGGQLVGKLAQNFGLDQSQASAALQHLVPMLAGGVQRSVGQQGGLESIFNALQGGNHDQYLDDHTQLGQQQAVDDGNSILGQIFGSKDVSRQVAAHAANNTGIDASVLTKMLPVVASVVMGAMKQRAGGAGGLSNLQAGLGGGGQSPLGGLLTSFLDHNRDGSVVDDVLGMLLKR